MFCFVIPFAARPNNRPIGFAMQVRLVDFCRKDFCSVFACIRQDATLVQVWHTLGSRMVLSLLHLSVYAASHDKRLVPYSVGYSVCVQPSHDVSSLAHVTSWQHFPLGHMESIEL